MSYLDDTGLAYFWTKIKAYVSSFLTWANIQNKPSTFAPSAHSHGNITNAGELGTASRAVVTDGNKKVSVSSVTSTELGCLSGVTSNVQTQLNGKADASAIPSIPSLSRTISGSGNAITDITVSGHAITATKGSTFLTSHQTLPTLSLTTSGNGNAITALSVSNHAITATKGSTFLTSHQSLANYVTLNGAQTISGAKTFTGEIIGINKENSTDNANSLYSTTVGSKLTYYTTTNGGTKLTNVPAAVNTTLESRTIRRLSDSDWMVDQICHNSNGLYYRRGSSGTWGAWKTFAFTDSNITGNAATVSGTAGTSLLAWGTENTVYTVGGHAIKVKLPANPNTDTHWTSHLYAGASNGNANAATTNGNTYLIICDNSTARDRRLIKGTGATTVTSDANGVITINSTDNNTTYSVSTTGSGNAVTSVSLSGTAITATKGSTFLTSHQSLANYVTLNSAQTISAVKTFTAYPRILHEFYIYNTWLDYKTTPSASGYFNIYWLDKNDKSLGRILGFDNTYGDRAFAFSMAPKQSTHELWDLFATGIDSSNHAWAAFTSHCTRVYPNAAGCTLGENSVSRRWGQIYSSSTSISTSDERVKTEIQEVPDAVLDCWEGISWLQFKMKDSVSAKGGAARVHNGAIAQRILEAFSAAGLDASRYGLFCYDKWDFEADLTDDEGNVIHEGQEGGDLYSLRYEEALCMEAAFQRRENARLKKRIADLEERLAALEFKAS